MTTDEFIEAVNAVGGSDFRSIVGKYDGVSLFKNGKMIAMFDGIKWSFVASASKPPYLKDVPTEILKLMVELAESREDDNKYVVLNGKPYLLDGRILTRVFVINAGNLSFATVRIDELNDFAYTKAELEQLKATLPKELQDAVDMLTVTVSEAKKVLKNDYME